MNQLVTYAGDFNTSKLMTSVEARTYVLATPRTVLQQPVM